MSVITDIIKLVNDRISKRLNYKKDKRNEREYISYKRSNGTTLKISRCKIYDLHKGNLRTHFVIEEYGPTRVIHNYIKLSRTEAMLLYITLKNFIESKDLDSNLQIEKSEE